MGQYPMQNGDPLQKPIQASTQIPVALLQWLVNQGVAVAFGGYVLYVMTTHLQAIEIQLVQINVQNAQIMTELARVIH